MADPASTSIFLKEPSMTEVIPDDERYDVVVIGAGIAGSALAYALGNQGRRVLLLERDLSEPDRIVGELLQPGGVLRLEKLGLGKCLEGIDATDARGYCVITNTLEEQEQVMLPYPDWKDIREEWKDVRVIGKSFHHGRFVQKLRQAARSVESVTVREATVKNVVDEGGVTVGAMYIIGGKTYTCYAPLTFVCDGCFSKFRGKLQTEKPNNVSNFLGIIMKDTQLPSPNFGHVFLADPGPILCYQIASNEIRVLVDVTNPMPQNIPEYLKNHTAPQLHPSIRGPFVEAVNSGRVRSMPNSCLHPSPKCIQPGVVFVGDSWNMRHPLTGGGMTVALSDVLIIRDALQPIKDFSDVDKVTESLQENYLPQRKGFASTINILSFALHSVFCASDDPVLPLMRRACLDYFKLGGTAVSGPLSLLSGMVNEPTLLLYHFFRVALYGCYQLLVPFPWPSNIIKSWKLLGAASWIVIPLMKGEGVFGWTPSILSFIFQSQKKGGK